MSRIDEIKERTKRHENLNDDLADINFLLYKLEIAHKALQEILEFDDRNQVGAVYDIARRGLGL